jgi:pSer/pThr/pTyr-binding forkhead associated (FHA) protein
MVEETTTSRTASTTTTTENEMGSENGRALSFYYMDVGSTNGTTHNGTSLEPNTKLILVNGMELKIGNSTLMIRLLGM